MAKRCQHDLTPLVEHQTDLEGAFMVGLYHLGGLLLCRRCGRVGYYTRWARRLAWLRPILAEKAKKDAEEFRLWDAARKAAVKEG